MRKFIDTADSRKTSPEIMDAIEFLANGNDELAGRIWAEPTLPELIAIQERATKNGLIDASDLYWGAASNRWAE
jgi:hypothetical protein